MNKRFSYTHACARRQRVTCLRCPHCISHHLIGYRRFDTAYCKQCRLLSNIRHAQHRKLARVCARMSRVTHTHTHRSGNNLPWPCWWTKYPVAMTMRHTSPRVGHVHAFILMMNERVRACRLGMCVCVCPCLHVCDVCQLQQTSHHSRIRGRKKKT